MSALQRIIDLARLHRQAKARREFAREVVRNQRSRFIVEPLEQRLLLSSDGFPSLPPDLNSETEPPALIVTNFSPTSTGFSVRFNQAIDPGALSLYDVETGTFGAADATLVGATDGTVKGSLVVSKGLLTFVARDGVLSPGNYTVTLRSATDAIKDATGDVLDGDYDGTAGGNYTNSFTAGAAQSRILGISDFARGPGQVVNVTASEEGIPITLSDGNGVTAVSFSLRYDSSLLIIKSVQPGADLPAGAIITSDLSQPGVVRITMTSGVSLGIGVKTLFRLSAEVPHTAGYGKAGVLDLSDITINGNLLSVLDDDGIQVAAYFGETTGNQRYSALDAQRTLRVSAGLDSGFAAYPAIDPNVIADITANGAISALDGTRILQEVAGLDRPEIAPITPVIVVGLAHDSGLSATDGITNDPMIQGTAVDDGSIVEFQVSLDAGGFVNAFSDLSGNGISLTRTRLEQLFGTVVTDASHVLRFKATDDKGNPSTIFDLSFVLDTSVPVITSFGLSAGSDTGIPGDNITSGGIVSLVGNSEPHAMLKLGTTDILVGGGGVFQIPNVALGVGDNTFTISTEDTAGNVAQRSLTVTRQGTVTADVALIWNQQALEAVRLTVTDPPIASRALAMMSIAQFDTLAAIEGTPAYLVHQTVSSEVSVDVALAKAAHTVLYALFPGLRASFDAALNSLLSSVADGAAKTNALSLGLSIGSAILAIRSNDGSNEFVEYDGSSVIGEWRTTAPMFNVSEEPQWADVTPFALSAPDELRPVAPPALDSAAYAASVEETRSLGSATSSAITVDQTQTAQFWADGKGSYTPVGHWNVIAQSVALNAGNSLSTNIRLFAQLNAALADSGIAAWDAKYTYNLWRPIDAIHNADLDDNPATIQDSGWTPLLITPAHPEYVSGHSTFSAAAAAILAANFGDNTAFDTTAFTLPGVTKHFTSFTQAAQEAGRSRIYGGIHYEFTNQAGQELGREVAQAVLARFVLNQDTQAPNIIVNNAPSAANTNITVTGQILDNISGVDHAGYRIDNGTLQNITLDAQGNFSITTVFTLNGFNDGTHTIAIIAVDAAENESTPFTRTFILDTIAPVLVVSTPTTGTTLDAVTQVMGTATGTGTSVASLFYRFDNGALRPVSFDPATGAFESYLDQSKLSVGSHTLTVVARDGAGNSTESSVNVSLAELYPFALTGLTPSDGSVDVGTTYRPQLYFSRAVDPTSLTNTSFFTTDSTGQTVPAKIVTAVDGSFAWLFFTNPLPGADTITIHVVGDSIRPLLGTDAFDANRDGVPGGTVTIRFTTVSLVAIPGTTLSGRVVDPGPDLEPMSFDDIRRGPDGVIHTDDDVFLNPLAGVKVFIVGLESQVVFTDAQGLFQFNAVPVGDVKVAVDGRTATNAPAGFFFPEMVMDVALRPGQANTLMGGMGTLEEQFANAARKEVYLPRLRSDILQNVSSTNPTTVTVSANSSPELSDAQRGLLSLQIQPGTLIGPDGLPVANPQVGISTVPPELVQDMLPPGVLQHTFDITIQAPGAAVFTAPATMTFPNVFNAAPGTQLNFLSFDHTTGMLVIEGTATVSADGLTVTTDPGTGITKPGWHGFTLPLTCLLGGGVPGISAAVIPIQYDPVVLPMIFGETGNPVSDLPFNVFTWTAPPAVPPPLLRRVPPPAGPCPVPPPPGTFDPMVEIEVKVDGPLSDFMEQVGNVPLVDLPATQLLAGSGRTIEFLAKVKKYADLMLDGRPVGGLNRLEENILYGSKITATRTVRDINGDVTTDIRTYFLYRFVDATDGVQDKRISFEDTINDGANGIQRSKPIDVRTGPNSTPDLVITQGNANFSTAQFPSNSAVLFDPTTTTDLLDGVLLVRTPDGRDVPGEIKLLGDGTPKLHLDVNAQALAQAFGQILADVNSPLPVYVRPELFTAAERAMIDTSAERAALASDVEFQVSILFGFLAEGIDIGPGPNSIEVNWQLRGSTLHSGWLYGDSSLPAPADGIDDEAKILSLFGNLASATNFLSKSAAVQGFMLSDALNQSFQTNLTVYADEIGEEWRLDPGLTISYSEFVTALANTVSHEAAHTLGAFHVAAIGTAAATGLRTLTLTGGASTDQYVLEFGGEFTSPIPRNAPASLIAAALGSLTTIGSGNVSATGNPGGPYTIEFINYLQGVGEPISAHPVNPATIIVTVLNPARTLVKLIVPAGGLSNDIMARANPFGTKLFQSGGSFEVLKVGLHIDWSEAEMNAAIKSLIKAVAQSAVIDAVDGLGNDNASVKLALGPRLAVFSPDGSLVNQTVDLGTESADGNGGAQSAVPFEMFNYGSENLLLDDVRLVDATRSFRLVAVPAGTVVRPGGSFFLDLSFDPAVAGPIIGEIIVESNDASSPLTIQLKAFGMSPTPHVDVTIPQNNFGGVAIGGDGPIQAKFATITNQGALPLVISGIQISEGLTSFSLANVPSDLAAHPITLAFGQSYSFGLDFSPDKSGLIRGIIDITTNDPAQPVAKVTAVGTGYGSTSFAWGEDFVSIETPSVKGAPVFHAVSDDAGRFSVSIAPKTNYHITVFDPVSGLVAHGYGTTPVAGRGLDVTSGLIFRASTAPDTDFDGLPDDIETAIGSSLISRDTDKDGLSDFVEIQQGLDPLGGLGIPLGVVGAVKLSGTANEVVVVGSVDSPSGQTAYVATGSYGLAIVDVSQLTRPKVFSQLDLSGTAVDVAVDEGNDIAVIAATTALHFIDVSNPAAPQLLQTIAVNATQVEIADGIAYVSVGNLLQSYTTLTREKLQEVTVAANPIRSLAREGAMLYAVTGVTGVTNASIRAIDISGFAMALRGSLVTSIAPGRIFVGNGVAYVSAPLGASGNLQGGFITIDVSNPDSLLLISGRDVPPQNAAPGTAIVANGSGLALLAGRTNVPSNSVTVANVLDLTNTFAFLTEFLLSSPPLSIAIGSGVAFVADGADGLQVLNYQSFDTLGVPPLLTLTAPGADENPAMPGIQVTTGKVVPVKIQVTDDQQVRNVELLVDNVVVRNDVSFPWDITSITAIPGSPGANTLSVLVRATDTGGNVTLSAPLTFILGPDLTPPQILNSNISNGMQLTPTFRTIRYLFSEAMDAATLNAQNFQIMASNGQAVAPLDVLVSGNGRKLTLTYPTLAPDFYQFQINAAAVKDVAGNPLGSQLLTTQFTPPFAVLNAVTLPGVVVKAVAEGDPDDPAGMFLYVLSRYIPAERGETSDHAQLTILDVRAPAHPLILGQVVLDEVFDEALDLAYDASTKVVVVAMEAHGLQIVDVSNPLAPHLLKTIPTPSRLVEVLDGMAYVATSTNIEVVSLATGVRLQVVQLPESSSGPPEGLPETMQLAREGRMLYAIYGGFFVPNIFQVFEITATGLVTRGSLTNTSIGSFANDLVVAEGIAYIPANPNASSSGGGFYTINVSNPDAPVLLSAPDASAFGSSAIAVDGGGRALLTGHLGPIGNIQVVVDVMNVTVPANTGTSIRRIVLQSSPSISADEEAVSIVTAGGVAFVSQGIHGTQIVNYLAGDTASQSPLISLVTSATDVDPAEGGIQVLEGSFIPLRITATDDVQVRTVDLLVNGQVVRTDVSFPWDESILAPAVTGSPVSLSIQARATDLGGRVTTSAPLVIGVVKDTFAPTLVTTNLANGSSHGAAFKTIRLTFSEPMDAATLTAQHMRLLNSLDADISPTQVSVSSDGRSVELEYAPLALGAYRFFIDESDVKDRASNALGGGSTQINFTIIPATITWINAAGGFWDVASNWSTGVLPGPNDDVVIDMPGTVTITHRSGTTTINSLRSTNNFTLSGGKLTVADTIQIDGAFTLTGGSNGGTTLAHAKVLRGAAGATMTVLAPTLGEVTFDGVRLQSDLTTPVLNTFELRVRNGLTLDGARITIQSQTTGSGGDASILFIGSQTLAGTGEILFSGPGLGLVTSTGGSLTLDSGVLIHGPGSGTLGGTIIINKGVIRADVPGVVIAVNASSVLVNEGRIEASNGGEVILESVQNQGVIEVTSGSTLQLLGLWTNPGTINATNATVDLGGVFRTHELDSFFRNGGTVFLSGQIINIGNTLDLDQHIGSLEFTIGSGVDSGIIGGIVRSAGQASLLIANSFGNQSLLDGVTLAVNLTLRNNTIQTFPTLLTITNGLTLDQATITLESVNSADPTLLRFIGPQLLGGNGQVVFTGTAAARFDGNGPLTIGPGITIRAGQGSFAFASTLQVINQGVIRSEVAGKTFDVGQINNQGILEATNGGILSLTAQGSWSNTGVVKVNNGGALQLNGSFTLAVLGTILNVGGTVNLTGTLNNAGATLSLNATTGSWTLSGGTIVGGTIAFADGSTLITTAAGGTLNGVTLNGNMTIANGHFVTITNGLTLNGVLTLASTGSNTELRFSSGTQTLGGSGEVVLGGTSSNNRLLLGSGGAGTVTLGANVNVHGRGTFTQSSAGTLINNGIISADVSGQTLSISVNSFTNNSIVQAINGATLSVSNFAPNSGTVIAGLGSLVNIIGAFTNNINGSVNLFIGGTSPGLFGRLSISGVATLRGTLNVSLANGFIPGVGQSFPLITYASHGTSMFDTINGLAIGGGLVFTPTYNATNFTLTTGPAS